MHELLLALSLLTNGDDTTTPAEVPVTELAAAGKSVVDADSYAFEITIEETRGKGERDAPLRKPITGSFAKGQPLHLRSGDIEAFMAPGKFVHRSGDGTWTLLERVEGWDESSGDDPLVLLQRVVPPHELLAGIEKSVTSVTRSAQEGTVTFEASLTEEAARHFGSPRAKASKPADDDPERDFVGTLTLLTGAAGNVESIRIMRTTKTHRDDGVRVRSRVRTLAVRDVGSTKVEVPAEVAKLLGQ